MRIVAASPYEATDATIDSQIVSLQSLGADVLYDVTSAKFSAQAIKKAAEINWKPVVSHNLIRDSRIAAGSPGSDRL